MPPKLSSSEASVVLTFNAGSSFEELLSRLFAQESLHTSVNVQLRSSGSLLRLNQWHRGACPAHESAVCGITAQRTPSAGRATSVSLQRDGRKPRSALLR